MQAGTTHRCGSVCLPGPGSEPAAAAGSVLRSDQVSAVEEVLFEGFEGPYSRTSHAAHKPCSPAAETPDSLLFIV